MDTNMNVKREILSKEIKDVSWARDYGAQYMATCLGCHNTIINSRICDYCYIIPLHEEGKNTVDNIRAFCSECIVKKVTEVERHIRVQEQIHADEMLAKSLMNLSIDGCVIPPDRELY